MINYNRRKTYQVKVGKLIIGSDNNIVVQSMTNTDTFDISATAKQVISITKAGAELVRVTAQNVNAANKLSLIKEKLRENKYEIPLVADIHFSPKAAEISAGIVEKVRVNPGNYTDTKKNIGIEYSDKSYALEVDKIKQKFVPLIMICKKYGTAVRIGANHGSLSDRIMSRHGDTPLGMVKSTLEFLRICIDNDFKNVVISMKASNPLVMIQACRLLIEKMDKENMMFPLHLGVTEAGEGIPGRVKSVAGIATLLADGIGDTIRVSLTESPEDEIPVAKRIIENFNETKFNNFIPIIENVDCSYNPFNYKRRKTRQVRNIGGDKIPVIITDLSKTDTDINFGDLIPDYIFCSDNEISCKIPKESSKIIHTNSRVIEERQGAFPFFHLFSFFDNENVSDILNFVEIKYDDLLDVDFNKLRVQKNLVIVANINDKNSPILAGRLFLAVLEQNNIDFPVIIKLECNDNFNNTLIKASGIAGSLFIDGMGDGIWLTNQGKPEETNNLSFEILQACRVRVSKTEYISCPSCGRTLFDLQKVSAEIREKTSHLKHLKIGIMGCIVNGPGEMADADYGYVGTSKGKITLYKKQEIIKQNIPQKNAVQELLNLIEKYENIPH